MQYHNTHYSCLTVVCTTTIIWLTGYNSSLAVGIHDSCSGSLENSPSFLFWAAASQSAKTCCICMIVNRVPVGYIATEMGHYSLDSGFL